MINDTKETVCRNEENSLEDDKNEYNCTDMHTSWLFGITFYGTGSNTDNSKVKGQTPYVYSGNDTIISSLIYDLHVHQKITNIFYGPTMGKSPPLKHKPSH